MAGVLTAVSVSGCTSASRPGPVLAYSDDGVYLPWKYGEGLVPDAQSPIPDVPKPIGFVPVPSRSSSSFDGYARTVEHVYQGRAAINDVLAFYETQLKYHGWKPENANQPGPIRGYGKGRESLKLSAGGAGGVTSVTIVIRPAVPEPAVVSKP
jgi:hypothetical protein